MGRELGKGKDKGEGHAEVEERGGKRTRGRRGRREGPKGGAR